jgi:uncharacterized damage-inducible protein DinB
MDLHFDLTEATAVLARSPAAVEALLTGLPEEWLHRTDGPGSWSAYDILGHLIHAEATDWMPRTRMILEHGTDRPFEPFDRAAMLTQAREPVEALLPRFRSARQANLARLASLQLDDGDLRRRGVHPDLGEVTLGQLLATWVAHDLTHLGQMGEVLARHYRDDIGPWRRHLPAMERVAEAE